MQPPELIFTYGETTPKGSFPIMVLGGRAPAGRLRRKHKKPHQLSSPRAQSLPQARAAEAPGVTLEPHPASAVPAPVRPSLPDTHAPY